MQTIIIFVLGVAIIVAGALYDNSWTPLIGGGLLGFALSDFFKW